MGSARSADNPSMAFSSDKIEEKHAQQPDYLSPDLGGDADPGRGRCIFQNPRGHAADQVNTPVFIHYTIYLFLLLFDWRFTDCRRLEKNRWKYEKVVIQI